MPCFADEGDAAVEVAGVDEVDCGGPDSRVQAGAGARRTQIAREGLEGGLIQTRRALGSGLVEAELAIVPSKRRERFLLSDV